MFYKLNKPKNVFCNKYVRNIAKKINVKKIGHNGTLDPLAKGLVIFATDEDLKLLEYVSNKSKTYIAKAKFGYISDTLDIQGNVIKKHNIKVNLKKLQSVLLKITKQTKQIPPKVSAKKINGQRAYNLQRNNKDFELKPCDIKIFEIKLLNFDYENQEFEFYVRVSEGTYIRSIIRDIGILCQSDAIMTELQRICIGNIKIDNLKEEEFDKIMWQQLFNINYFILDENNVDDLLNGKQINTQLLNKDLIFVVNKNKDLILSVGNITNQKYQPHKVFRERIINEYKRKN